MAENPNPENLGYGIAAVIALVAGIGAFFKGIYSRSTPCDDKNAAFKKQMAEDVAEMKGELKRAIEKASESHEKIFDRMRALERASDVSVTRLGHLEEALGSLDARLTTCQQSVNVMKRNGT